MYRKENILLNRWLYYVKSIAINNNNKYNNYYIAQNIYYQIVLNNVIIYMHTYNVMFYV